ncbi:MAG: hypothetical protein WKF66_15605 [Pedobacter sp.]
MKFKDSIAGLLAQDTKQSGKLTVVLLAGIALGGVISTLFSSKKLLKIQKGNSGGARTINIKDSYTEMSNRLAN